MSQWNPRNFAFLMKNKGRSVVGGAAVLALLAGASATVRAGEFNPFFPGPFKYVPYVPSASIEKPDWRSARVARILFSKKGEMRRDGSRRGLRNDFEYYSFPGTEEGWISGELLWSVVQPMDRKTFEQQLRLMGRLKDGDTQKVDSLFKEYLQGSLNRSMAAITLNKILDHEAMKRKLEPKVLEERVDYVVRSLIGYHALSIGKITSQELRRYAESAREETLYRYLKDAVGERDVRFNIDWQFREGMEMEQESLSRGADASLWRETRLEFSKLPAELEEFKELVREKLNAQYRPTLRMAVWGELIRERYPFLSFESLFSIRSTELQKMYEALGEKTFTVQESSSEIFELIVEGPRAAEFKKALDEKLNSTAKEIYQKLSAEIQAGTLKQEDVPARLTLARTRDQKTVLEEVRAQFSEAMAANELTVRLVEKSFSSKDEVKPPLSGGEADPIAARESQERSVALNPFFGASGVFPRQQIASGDSSLVFIFLKELRMEDKSVLPISDPKVDRVLRARLQSKIQGKVFRELAYRLFKENRLEAGAATCMDTLWPCTALDPETLATSLFPEQLYPGASLGNYGPQNPIESTLNEPQLMDRVMTISVDALQTVFSLPNPEPSREK
jgi:hypothetical protein